MQLASGHGDEPTVEQVRNWAGAALAALRGASEAQVAEATAAKLAAESARDDAQAALQAASAEAAARLGEAEARFAEERAELAAALSSEGDSRVAAEGARDDRRCGIGFHATDGAPLEHVDEWGRNALGHACMGVARYLAHVDEAAGAVPDAAAG